MSGQHADTILAKGRSKKAKEEERTNPLRRSPFFCV
jgi:ubiquitin